MLQSGSNLWISHIYKLYFSLEFRVSFIVYVTSLQDCVVFIFPAHLRKKKVRKYSIIIIKIARLHDVSIKHGICKYTDQLFHGFGFA